MREPTTIPEYKQFCKALKLKILKQKTTIDGQVLELEKLQSQIKLLKKSGLQIRNQNDPSGGFTPGRRANNVKNSSQVVDLESLYGKNQVMNKFKNGASSFGITPQSIFRIADFTYKGQVESDYFRQVLSKIDLGLTPMEISCLIYIFDQNCTGFISRDEYNDSLNAYQISLQESFLQYTNICLEKFARLLEVDRIQVLKFFQEMEGRSTNSVDLNKFCQKLKATFGKRLQTRQIMGAFNAIDLEGDGIICKKNFIYSVTSAMNKLSNHSAIKKTGSNEEHQNTFQRSNLSASGKKSAPNTFDNNISTTSVKIPKQPQINHTSSTQILDRLYNDYKVTLTQIYQQICRKPLEARLTLFQFKKVIYSLQDSKNKIDPDLSSQLFRAIDTGQKGTIHYRQLATYYMHHETDMETIFHLFAIYLQNSGYNLDSYWSIYGVGADSDISKAKFLQVMGKTFGSKDSTNQLWQKLWGYFDKGRGTVSVQQINRQINRYMSLQKQ